MKEQVQKISKFLQISTAGVHWMRLLYRHLLYDCSCYHSMSFVPKNIDFRRSKTTRNGRTDRRTDGEANEQGRTDGRMGGRRRTGGRADRYRRTYGRTDKASWNSHKIT